VKRESRLAFSDIGIFDYAHVVHLEARWVPHDGALTPR
jgi:hypothetical protein